MTKTLETFEREIAALIKKGDEARRQAEQTHLRRAGANLLEARSQMSHDNFCGWVKRNFNLSGKRAYELMVLSTLMN